MSKPKLYIKNDKGRYEPYELPKPDLSDMVYIKSNGKYYPHGRLFDVNFLTEGVWVVYGKASFCSGRYLREKFSLEKVSDIKYPSITMAELGGISKITNQAIDDLHRHELQKKANDDGWGLSQYDRYEFVIKRAIELLKEKQK
jgi:hypothetical protein